jgi:multimeric flavodoxin WrbA
VKIVGVIGSPSREGNTAALVRQALGAARAGGADVEEIFLPEHNLRFCQGCSRCLVEGRCHLPDDFEEIRTKVYAADGLVLGSPTYGGGPSAVMKNFFDRLGLYTVFTSSLAGKHVVGISTASAFGAKEVARKLTEIVQGPFGALFARAYVTGSLGVTRGGKPIEQRPEALAKARRLGDRLVEDIRRGRRHPFQNLYGRAMAAFILRGAFERSIKEYRGREMKAVYESLVSRGLIAAVGGPEPGREVGAGVG